MRHKCSVTINDAFLKKNDNQENKVCKCILISGGLKIFFLGTRNEPHPGLLSPVLTTTTNDVMIWCGLFNFFLYLPVRIVQNLLNQGVAWGKKGPGKFWSGSESRSSKLVLISPKVER